MTTRFPCLHIEGGLFAADLIDQIAEGTALGQKAGDFRLSSRTYLTDEIASAWADARALWNTFQHRLGRLDPEDPATSITRDQWMIPFLSLLGYELIYIPKASEIDGKTYAISHRAGKDEDSPPIHIVGCRQSLDRRPESARPRLAPHSLLQEYLNRSEHLWGIVTNGYTLRILRESHLMRRQAHIEFDIKQMMEGEKFSDFSLFFRLAHRTRLPISGKDPHESLLEQYYKITAEQGGRVRDRLRDGVEEALKVFANGFLSHPKNQELRQRVRDGKLSAQFFYQQLLRLIYRFLFLMVAEERNLITEDPIYKEHYSITRLRKLAELRSSYSDHEDLWLGTQTTFRLFQDEKLSELFGVPPLNGDLFNTSQTPDLQGISITNREFLTAIWNLSMYRENEKTPWRRVNYSALDVEELGSVYESLLDFQPVFRDQNGKPTFDLAYGTERKSTGSYYTPPELVNELIKSALVPVMEELLEEARRIASSEWRAVAEEIRKNSGVYQYVYSIIPRLRGLEKKYGISRAGIQTEQNIPKGRALRDDISSSESSSINTSKYSGGLGKGEYSGVFPISSDSSWQLKGIGNSFDSQPKSGIVQPGINQGNIGGMRYPESPDSRTSTEPPTEEEMKRLWNSAPLAIRTSLLAEQALLALKICDPASGSGHFLLAAARRLGEELARIRTGDDEPAPEPKRLAVRDVITHCIYGVDKNPLAVDLCKVALWIEGHTRGKPLTFLDHKIRCGDSLIGVFDLSVLKDGIPDKAFEPVTGDDKAVARILKKKNREERGGQRTLPFITSEELKRLEEDRRILLELPDDTPEQIRQKIIAYQSLQRHGTKWWRDQTACHLWTSAFFTELTSENERNRRIPTTDDLFRYLETHNLDGRLIGNVWALAQKHRFFHWPLEFPEILDKGGFDVVLGNPPFSAETPLGLVKFLNSLNFSVSNINSAALFVQRSHQLLNFNGQLGLVNPKSLTYSQRWSSIRKLLAPHLRAIIDCGHAWKQVLLEQIIFISSKTKIENGIEVGAILSPERRFINIKLLTQIDIIPCNVEKIAFDIINRVSKSSFSLGSVCKTFRGVGIQRTLSESGKFPVIGGKDIARYRIRGLSGFLGDECLHSKLEFHCQPKVIYQNIIAYVQRPQPHIKIAAYYDHDGIATLDTVNNVIPNSNDINPWALTGLLNSKVLNWIAWRFLYNKAQRTMHFDQYFLDRLVVPKSFLDVQSKIGTNVQEIQSVFKAGKREVAELEKLIDEIDQLVADCFELTEVEKNIIFSEFPKLDL